MEYEDIIFDNCPIYYKERIENINIYWTKKKGISNLVLNYAFFI